MLIHEVANKLKISKRTIRHYEQIGLIDVTVNEENGYRNYSDIDMKQLQKIVYFRSLNITLKDIALLLEATSEQLKVYLQQHLQQLLQEQEQLASIITQLQKTIQSMEDEEMAQKGFEQQKEQWLANNEAQYGEEIRERHGEESVMATYGKIKGMTEEQYEAAQQLETTLFERLQEAMEDESNDLYLEIAELHKRWLSFYWPKYTKQAHVGLAQMYVADERFTRYYDTKAGDGATQLLFEAIMLYSQQ